jgi:hypothetical protein
MILSIAMAVLLFKGNASISVYPIINRASVIMVGNTVIGITIGFKIGSTFVL